MQSNNVNREMGKEYISSLDGLRAIAIIGVLVYHIDHTLLSGGFIGVDIFFVISGYIITKNISQDLNNSNFSLSFFYIKRIARLFPSLAIVICFSLIAAYFVVGGDRLSQYGQTGLYSALSVSNIYFWLNSGYFEDSSQTNIFIHTWSLSVEEQFYLIWPILLVFIFYVAQKRALVIFILLFIIGAAFSLCLSLYFPSAMFYLMPARVFQFSIGAVVALVHLRHGMTPVFLNPFRSTVGFVIGLLLILYSYWTADGVAYSFWAAALTPTVGAALAILTLSNPVASRGLGNPFMTMIGVRAYSLYLIHWPVIVLSKLYWGSNLSILGVGAQIVVIAALTELLHQGIEKPLRIRSSNENPGVSGRAATVAGIAIVTTAFSAHVWALNKSAIILERNTAHVSVNEMHNGDSVVSDDPVGDRHERFAQRISVIQTNHGSVTRYAQSLWAQWVNYDGMPGRCQLGGRDPLSEMDWSVCMPQDARPTTVLLGDSLGREGFEVLRASGSVGTMAIVSKAGCLPVFPQRAQYSPPGCEELNSLRFDYIVHESVETVVLVGNWRNGTVEEITGTVEYLVSLGKRVVLFAPRPAFTESVPVLLDSAAGQRAAEDLSRYLQYDYEAMNAELTAAFSGAERDVFILRWADVLCPDGLCSSFFSEGTMIFLDDVHLTREATELVGLDMASEISAAINPG